MHVPQVRVPSAPSDFDVLLADGSTAHVRDIRPDDGDGLRMFHASLSFRSIVLRFFGPHPELSDKEVERFTNVDGADRVALVVERAGHMVAVARYDRAPGSDEAEVAFAVQDDFQGRGLGTVLLEHLASIARRYGIRRFIADTLSDNHRMLSVFHGAGFARKYSRESEVVRVVLDISPGPEALEATEERDRQSVVRSIERLLRPASIAVIGAARSPGTIGHQLLRNLLLSGFQGPVYPVNPAATRAAPSRAAELAEVPPGPTPEVDHQTLPDLLPEPRPEVISRFATRRLPGPGDPVVDGGGRGVHREALCPVVSSPVLRSVPLSADANSQWRQSKEPVE